MAIANGLTNPEIIVVVSFFTDKDPFFISELFALESIFLFSKKLNNKKAKIKKSTIDATKICLIRIRYKEA